MGGGCVGCLSGTHIPGLVSAYCSVHGAAFIVTTTGVMSYIMFSGMVPVPASCSFAAS